jgi:putative membrane protein
MEECAMKSMKEMLQKTALTAVLAGLAAFGASAQTSKPADPGANAGGQNPPSSTSDKMSSQSDKSSSQLDPADRTFVKKAAQGGLAEVELGKLATEKASSDEVKKFGQRMVDDHSKANDQLKQVASKLGVNVPDKLSPKDQATKDRLSKLSGEQFDAAYMRDMVKDHTKDVAEFRHESEKAKNDEVKNFASQALPTLEDHLKQAKSISPKEKREARNESKGKPSPARPQR